MTDADSSQVAPELAGELTGAWPDSAGAAPGTLAVIDSAGLVGGNETMEKDSPPPGLGPSGFLGQLANALEWLRSGGNALRLAWAVVLGVAACFGIRFRKSIARQIARAKELSRRGDRRSLLTRPRGKKGSGPVQPGTDAERPWNPPAGSGAEPVGGSGATGDGVQGGVMTLSGTDVQGAHHAPDRRTEGTTESHVSGGGAHARPEDASRVDREVQEALDSLRRKIAEDVGALETKVWDLEAMVGDISVQRLEARCHRLREALQDAVTGLTGQGGAGDLADKALATATRTAVDEARERNKRLADERRNALQLGESNRQLGERLGVVSRMGLPPTMVLRPAAHDAESGLTADGIRAVGLFTQRYRSLVLLEAVADLLQDWEGDGPAEVRRLLTEMDRSFDPVTLADRVAAWRKSLPGILLKLLQDLPRDPGTDTDGGREPYSPASRDGELSVRFRDEFVFNSRAWAEIVGPLLTADAIAGSYLVSSRDGEGSSSHLHEQGIDRIALAVGVLRRFLSHLGIEPHVLRVGEPPVPELPREAVRKIGVGDWMRGDALARVIGSAELGERLKRMPNHAILDVLTWGCDVDSKENTQSVVVVKSRLHTDSMPSARDGAGTGDQEP